MIVLLIVQEHQFGIVVKNWTIREALYSVFLQKFCIFILTKFNWLKMCSLLTTPNKDSLLNELTSADFSNKIIFILMTLLIVEIVAFVIQKIHEWLLWIKCIYNVSLFGADFRLIGPFFIENVTGQAITINRAR